MFSNFFKKNKTEETIVNVKETQQPVQQPAEQPLQKESPKTTIIAQQLLEGIDINEHAGMQTLVKTMDAIRQTIIHIVGYDFYESKLDTFDPMLFEAYKEAELQQMRADCAEAELEYYKACNDPNGFHGPQLRQMHERLLELKQMVAAAQQGQDVQPSNQQYAQSLSAGLYNNPEDNLEETDTKHSLNRFDDAINRHERPDIALSAPMPGTLPSLPINFD